MKDELRKERYVWKDKQTNWHIRAIDDIGPNDLVQGHDRNLTRFKNRFAAREILFNN